MTTKELNRKIARLEFEHDQLISELSYINSLLKSVGFPQGLTSVKEVAQELLNEEVE